eukprot:GGOE01055243.1.p2 GENE.GGOE01055243.1~~GGOE01055243.1.p2  ORF type:complete len:143 (-),score=55.94 GGOE01055243.1:219-617(-)
MAPSRDATALLKKDKLWEAAKSPRSGLFMNAFMMWMAGNEVHLFSIMITLMALVNSAKALFTTNSVFARLEVPAEFADDALRAKALFVLLNLVGLGMAMMKCYWLGLLPTAASDWVDGTLQLPVEFSSGSFI